MNTNTMELSMNEMATVNGAGLIDWIVIKVGLPLGRDWCKPTPRDHEDYVPFKDDDCFIE